MKQKGQAVIEYLLVIVVISVIIAVIIRNSNQFIYRFWTGLTRQVSSPCADCEAPSAPDL